MTAKHTNESTCNHGHPHDIGNTLSLAIILAVAVVIVAIVADADDTHGERREQTTTLLAKAGG